MSKKTSFLFGFIFSVITLQASNDLCKNDASVCLSPEEYALYDMINNYRIENNLPEINLSTSLSIVAKTHAEDFEAYGNPYDKSCNLHSWSNNGDWEGMCYSDDHAEAEKMWKKPSELTTYRGDGYEIAAKTTAIMTADLAFKLWKKSNGHNNVMVNQKTWEGIEWNAIGIGMYKGFACVWFGKEIDYEAEPIACY